MGPCMLLTSLGGPECSGGFARTCREHQQDRGRSRSKHAAIACRANQMRSTARPNILQCALNGRCAHNRLSLLLKEPIHFFVAVLGGFVAPAMESRVSLSSPRRLIDWCARAGSPGRSGSFWRLVNTPCLERMIDTCVK